jgi:hypothetical protein
MAKQPQAPTAEVQPAPVPPVQVSFASDIVPIFEPFREQMMWRFDLTSYDAVKANAQLIYGRLTGANGNFPMPPPPLSPLTAEQIETFQAWMTAGFPP